MKKNKRRVLHTLSQRPLLTGSGITLDAFIRCSALKGWDQHLVFAATPDEGGLEFDQLDPSHIHPLEFESSQLDFPVPGMSDVMPYPSTCFNQMTCDQLTTYRRAWRKHLRQVIEKIKPPLIHSHHIWLMSSLIKDVAGQIPVVTHCHATGFRQMALCSPELTEEIKINCRRNERFCVLHLGHAIELAQCLEVSRDRIHVIGAGCRDDLFHPLGRDHTHRTRLLYAGKLSAEKGLPQLLDAVEQLHGRIPDIELHVAGTGVGQEALAIERRMHDMSSMVSYHGQLSQPELADLMRTTSVFVLPSFYEGLPLVLVEAMQCGCRLVATELPGVVYELKPHLSRALELVCLPRLIGPDRPEPEDLPVFVQHLCEAIEKAIYMPPIDTSDESFSKTLESFSWNAVFDRVEKIWIDLIESERE